MTGAHRTFVKVSGEHAGHSTTGDAIDAGVSLCTAVLSAGSYGDLPGPFPGFVRGNPDRFPVSAIGLHNRVPNVPNVGTSLL